MNDSLPLYRGAPPVHNPDWTAPQDFPSLAGVKRIALDVETRDDSLSAGMGPGTRRGAVLIGVALAIDGGWRRYYPIRHAGGGNMPPAQVIGWLRAELAGYAGEVCGTNLIYDLDILAEAGITLPKVKRFLDVQIAEPLLDEHRLRYSLDALAMDYLNERKNDTLLIEAARAYGIKNTDKDIKSNLWRFPASMVGPYAEADVDLPLRIFPLQYARMEQEGLLRVFDVESRLIPILLAMRRRGVRIDVENAARVREALVRARDKLLAELKRLAGPRAEFMAADSLAPALRAAGLNVPSTTKSGKPSITKSFLEAHSGVPIIDLIRAGRRINTVINTFIDGYIGKHTIRGRIHTEFHQLKGDDGGTIGRFSSSNPNLQNVPSRDEEIAPMVRGLFLPDNDELWERHDQSQMEYRLLAQYARGPGAEECRARYVNDPHTDYHKFCAEVLGVDPNDKVARKRVKNTNFAKSYGAQAPRLALTFGCSVEEAKAFIRRYEEALPFTVETFNYASRIARERGYVVTLLGRRARFPLWEPANNDRLPANQRKPPLERAAAEATYRGEPLRRAKTYMALNRVLQLGNADCMKAAMVRIWETGICRVLGPPLLTVHDELDYSVPRTKEGDDAAQEARRLLETAINSFLDKPLRVPIIAEASRGATWGECN